MPLHCREGSRLSARCDKRDGWGWLSRCYSGAYGRRLKFRDSWQQQLANQQLVNRKGACDSIISSSISTRVSALYVKQEQGNSHFEGLSFRF